MLLNPKDRKGEGIMRKLSLTASFISLGLWGILSNALFAAEEKPMNPQFWFLHEEIVNPAKIMDYEKIT